MLHIRTFLFALIMSLAAHSNVYGSQTQVELYKTYNMNMGYFGKDPYGRSMDKRMTQKHLINAPAAGEEGYKIVEKALQCNDINVNAQNIHGTTVLHNAVINSKVGIVKLLLEKCPDLNINLTNHKGETPLDLAIDTFNSHDVELTGMSNLAIIKLLIASNAKCPQWLETEDFRLFYKQNTDHALKHREDELVTESIKNYYAELYSRIMPAYKEGKELCEQREEERAAYEQAVASQIDQHIPVKDLGKVIAEYVDQMSILQFCICKNKLRKSNKKPRFILRQAQDERGFLFISDQSSQGAADNVHL